MKKIALVEYRILSGIVDGSLASLDDIQGKLLSSAESNASNSQPKKSSYGLHRAVFGALHIATHSFSKTNNLWKLWESFRESVPNTEYESYEHKYFVFLLKYKSELAALIATQEFQDEIVIKENKMLQARNDALQARIESAVKLLRSNGYEVVERSHA